MLIQQRPLCARCDTVADPDPVVCLACSAVFHWDCYRTLGSCGRCQCGKPPVPLSAAVAPQPPPPQSRLLIGIALVMSLASFGGVAALWFAGPRAPERPIPPAPSPAPTPSVAPTVRAPAPSPAAPKPAADRMDLTWGTAPGRAWAHLYNEALKLALQRPVSLDVPSGRYSDLLVRLDTFGSGSEAVPIAELFLGYGAGKPPTSWTRHVLKGAKGGSLNWTRLHAEAPFDGVRILVHDPAGEGRRGDVLLVATDPPGTALARSDIEFVVAATSSTRVELIHGDVKLHVEPEVLRSQAQSSIDAFVLPDGKHLVQLMADGSMTLMPPGATARVADLAGHVFPDELGLDPDARSRAALDGRAVWEFLTRWEPEHDLGEVADESLDVHLKLMSNGTLEARQGDTSFTAGLPLPAEQHGPGTTTDIAAALESRFHDGGRHPWDSRHGRREAAAKNRTPPREPGLETPSDRQLHRFLSETAAPWLLDHMQKRFPPIQTGDRYALRPVAPSFPAVALGVVRMVTPDEVTVRWTLSENQATPVETSLPRPLFNGWGPMVVGQRLGLVRAR